jgi:DNA-binding NarL/FixJ family response regulator
MVMNGSQRPGGRHGASTRSDDVAPAGRQAGLTAHECAVPTASATGFSSGEVAEQLGVPPDAVRRSIASAMTKLGARSKLEAVVLALRHGLIVLSAG